MDPVTITVADIVAPGEGKKQGKVIDTTGKKWNVWADKLANYVCGATYRIDSYKLNNFNNQTFYIIDKATAIGGSAAPRAAASAPTPAAHYGEDPQKAEDIAVLAIIKEWVGRIPVGDTAALVHSLRAARTAWRQSKAKASDNIETGRPREDFNDEIDFK